MGQLMIIEYHKDSQGSEDDSRVPQRLPVGQ